eukprot:m.267595 g.267595  ORF g.267595 m.267595 type:complete len:152 (+) comp40518_c0_seq7:131-586(+)
MDNPTIDQEEIIRIQKTVLLNLRTSLVRDLDSTRYIAYLRQERIFDEDDDDSVRSPSVRRRQNEIFLDIIGRRGSKGFEEFCRALLEERTQSFLADRIAIEFDKVKAEHLRERGDRFRLFLLYFRQVCFNFLVARQAVDAANKIRDQERAE